MSLNVLRRIRGYLVSSSTVGTYVTDDNIKVGWPKTVDSFPCVLIVQSAGTDYGFLGYKTASAGSKIRREDCSYQIDIFSKNSRLETYQIADAIVKEMISGCCRKVSDMDDYDDELGIYRKVQTYSCNEFHDD